MNKFHQIPTDTFVPISHDNSYLFNHYDKIANFLAFNLEKNYKNILAKPVQNGYMFDWFSIYDNLISNNDKNKEESENELLKYWEFIEVINAKINQLSNSNDENNKNWAKLLTKVFNQKDNFIFSNGNNICIVWGWKFNNNEIYKPNLTKRENIIAPEIQPSEKHQATNIESEEQEPTLEGNPEDDSFSNDQVDEIIEEEIIKDSSFLEFLKWFASKYWWLLWLLTSLIALVFFIKTFAFKVN